MTIVDFIYNPLRDRLPDAGQQLSATAGALHADLAAGHDTKLRLLSISFDGARDDPQRCRPALPGLWPTPVAPYARARCRKAGPAARWGVVVIPDGRGDYEHNAALLVFDSRAA